MQPIVHVLIVVLELNSHTRVIALTKPPFRFLILTGHVYDVWKLSLSTVNRESLFVKYSKSFIFSPRMLSGIT